MQSPLIGAIQNESKPADRIKPYAIDAFTVSLEWAQALRQLEKETGMPFVAATAFFGGTEHIMAKLAQEISVDYSSQLEMLQKMWDIYCPERTRLSQYLITKNAVSDSRLPMIIYSFSL